MTDLGLMRMFTPHHKLVPTTAPPPPLRIVDLNGDPLDELRADGLEAFGPFEIVAVYPLEIGVLNCEDHEEIGSRAAKHGMNLCPECICTALRAQYDKDPVTKDSDLFIDFEDRIFFLRKR